MLCINVSQQCLFIVYILKVCVVFHPSFFSDVCDYAWNKKLIRALLSQPRELLWKHMMRAAGSWQLDPIGLSSFWDKGRTTVATQREAWCCGALLGGHRKGSETKSPLCGVSFCQFHDPLYHQKMSPGSRGGGAVLELPLAGDLGPTASSLCIQWPHQRNGDGDPIAFTGLLWE